MEAKYWYQAFAIALSFFGSRLSHNLASASISWTVCLIVAASSLKSEHDTIPPFPEMPVAKCHESADQLPWDWEGRRVLDVDETINWIRLVGVEAKLLPKLLGKRTVEDNVLTRFVGLVADFTHRAAQEEHSWTQIQVIIGLPGTQKTHSNTVVDRPRPNLLTQFETRTRTTA